MHFLQANQYKLVRIQWLEQCPLLLLRTEVGFLVILCTLQGHNTENSKQILPEKELNGQSLNFHIHVSVSDLKCISHDWFAYSAAGKYVDRSWDL